MKNDGQIIGADMDAVRSVFGVVHGVGKGLLNAFGMGGLAQGLEKVETAAGLLPNTDAPPVVTQPPQAPEQQDPPPAAIPVAPVVSGRTVVVSPDAAVLIRNLPGGHRATGLRGLRQVTVFGGTRFAGNGYKKDDPIGQTFSFGVDRPSRIEVINSKGRRSLVSARQILFLGGTESTAVVGAAQYGEDMSQRSEIDLIESQVLGGPFNSPDYRAQEWKVATRPQDFAQTSTYKTAAAGLAAAQARQADALARLQRAKAPSTFTPTAPTIPSFSFSPASPPLAPAPISLPPIAVTDLPPPAATVEAPPSGGVVPTTTPDGRQIDWGDATRPGDWTPNMSDTQNAGIVGSEPGWLEMTDVLGEDVLGEDVLGELDAVIGGGVVGRRRHKSLCPVVRCPHCSVELCVVQAEQSQKQAADVVGALASVAQVCRGAKSGSPRALTKTGSAFAGACPCCGTRLELTLGSTAPCATIAPAPVSTYEHGSAVVGSSYYVGVASPKAAAAGNKVAGPKTAVAKPAVAKPVKPTSQAQRAAQTFSKPGAKSGSVKVRAATRSKAKSPHLAAIKRTESVIKYAESRAKKVEKKADAYKPKDHKTIIPVKLGDVKGKTILGSDKVLSPKQQSAVQKHTNALVTHHKAVSAAKGAAKKARAAAAQAKDAIKKAKPQIAKLSKKGALRNIILGVDAGYEEVVGDELLTVVGDDLDQVVGEIDSVLGGPGWDEIMGAVPPLSVSTSAAPLSSVQSGSANASADANGDDQEIADLLNILDYIDDLIGDLIGEDMSPPGGSASAADPTVPAPAGGSTASLDAAADSDASFDDAGDIPLPTRGEPLSAEEAKVVYWTKADLPEDAVFYQGDRGVLNNALGSWNTFYGKNPNKDGFSDGWLNGVASGKEGWSATDKFLSVLTGGAYAVAKEIRERKLDSDSQGIVRWVYRAPETQNPEEFMTPPDEFVNNVKKIAKNSIERGWGPLIGNPRGDLAGLQFCMETGDFFWQGNHAPVWATAVADAKITELNKKTAAAKQAAAEADAAARAQEQAAQAEAQAKQDAANALAQSVADTQANIARQALEAQQGQQALQQQQQQAATAAAQAQAAIVQQQQQTAADAAAQKHQQEMAALQAKAEAELLATYQQQDAEQRKVDIESQRAMLEWAKSQGAMPPAMDGGAASGEGDGGEGGEGVDYGASSEDGGLDSTGSDRGREDRSE